MTPTELLDLLHEYREEVMDYVRRDVADYVGDIPALEREILDAFATTRPVWFLFWTDARALALESRLLEPGVERADLRRRIFATETALREECERRARAVTEASP